MLGFDTPHYFSNTCIMVFYFIDTETGLGIGIGIVNNTGISVKPVLQIEKIDSGHMYLYMYK